MGEKAERSNSNSVFLINPGNTLLLYGFMAAYYSHRNNLAKFLSLIFGKNFWVTMVGMNIKRRLADRKFYVEKKHGQSKKAERMNKYINILLI